MNPVFNGHASVIYDHTHNIRRRVKCPSHAVAGFTLVELLVVISIIALLIALLLPALAKAKQVANSIVCSSNIREMVTAVMEYQDSNSEQLAPNYGFNAWMVPLAPYLTNSGTNQSTTTGYQINFQKLETTLVCPSTTPLTEANMNGSTNFVGGVTTPWYWQAASPFYDNQYALNQVEYCQSSYCFNGWLWNLGTVPSPSQNPPAQCWPNNITSVPTTLVPVFGDGLWLNAQPLETDVPPPLDYVDGQASWPIDTLPNFFMGRFCITRHSNGINLGFMDGHVQYIDCKQLWSQDWASGWVTQKPPPAGVSTLP